MISYTSYTTPYSDIVAAYLFTLYDDGVSAGLKYGTPFVAKFNVQ